MASAIPRFECPTIPKTHLTPQFDMVSAHTSDDVHVRVASGEGSGDFSAKASDLPETAPAGAPSAPPSGSKRSLPTPQTGQTQPSGRLSHPTPSAASSYSYPHTVHLYFILSFRFA